MIAQTSIVKDRQTDWWYFSCNKQGKGLGGGGVPCWRGGGAVHIPYCM